MLSWVPLYRWGNYHCILQGLVGLVRGHTVIVVLGIVLRSSTPQLLFATFFSIIFLLKISLSRLWKRQFDNTKVFSIFYVFLLLLTSCFGIVSVSPGVAGPFLTSYGFPNLSWESPW
jgi:hypothetical protein